MNFDETKPCKNCSAPLRIEHWLKNDGFCTTLNKPDVCRSEFEGRTSFKGRPLEYTPGTEEDYRKSFAKNNGWEDVKFGFKGKITDQELVRKEKMVAERKRQWDEMNALQYQNSKPTRGRRHI